MSTKTKTKKLVIIMNFSELFKQSGQLCQFSPDGQYLVSPNHTVKCREGIDGVDNLDHAQLHVLWIKRYQPQRYEVSKFADI